MRSRILIVIDRFYPIIGGAETQAYNLATYLAKNNYGVKVLTRQVSKDLKKVDKLNGFTVYRVPIQGGNRADQNKFSLLVPYYLFKFRNSYDIIHCSDIFSILGLASIVTAKLLNKKIVGRFTTIGITKVNFLSKFIKPKILNFLDAAICSSEAIAKEVKELIKSDKTVLIRHSFDTNKFKPVSSEEKIRLKKKLNLNGKIIVLFVGRLVGVKRPDMLLKAWLMLRNSEYRKQFESSLLLFLGSGKFQWVSTEEELKEFATSQNFTNVKFLGDVYNVDEYYKSADIVVIPSEKDLPSNVLLEGMLCGLAPITADIPPNREVIVPNYNGMLFENLNVNELFAKLSDLISNTKLLNKIKKNSPKIKATYSIENVGKKYIELYHKLVSNNLRTSSIH